MGVDLFGKTVSTTYDSLIKVGDNDTLTSSAKRLSDGRGNDSAIWLSTTNMGINAAPTAGYTLTVNGNLLATNIDTNSLQLLGGTGDQGTLSWNTDEETVDIIQNGAVLQVGQEIQVHVKNQTASTIPDGTPVYVTGTLGASGRLTVAPFIADGSIDGKYFLGVTTEEIINGDDGKVTTFGKIRGLDTSAYSEGDTLFISDTTAGAFTTTAPTSPSLVFEIAIVINSHATNGTIFVRTGGTSSAGSTLQEVTDNGNTTTNSITVGGLEVEGTSAEIILTDTSASPDGGTVKLSNVNTDFIINVDPDNVADSSTIQFELDGAERMRINANGTGIGTVSPQDILHIYNDAGDANVMVQSVSSGGDARLKLIANSSGVSQIRFEDEADPNVGLLTYDHSDNSMQFRTADSERMRLTSAGSLGIGTTDPDTILHLAETAPIITFEDTTDGSIADILHNGGGMLFRVDRNNITSTSRFIFEIDGDQKMRLDDGGDLGIGVTSPSARVHAYHPTINVVGRFESGDSIAYIDLHDSNSVGSYGVLLGAVGNDFVISPSATERARFTNTGKIGVGTSTPTNIAHIKTSTNGEGLTLQVNSVTEGDYSQLSFLPSTAEATAPPVYIRGVRGSSISTSYLTFNTDETERLRIDSSGNVGIGTTPNAASKLHVKDDDGAEIRIEDNTSTTFEVLRFTGDGSTGEKGLIGYNSSNAFAADELHLFNSKGDIVLRTDNAGGTGTGVLTVSSIGNVGINWSTPAYSLDIREDEPSIQLYETLSGTNTRFRLEVDSTGTTYTTTFGSGGGKQHIWKGGSSEVMRLDQDGNLGIGTTSPTHKVDVEGLVQLGEDGTYGSSYGMIGFGGTTNGEPRIFGGLSNKILYVNSGTGGNIHFRTNGASTNKVVIDTDGNVGIGTDSPTSQLDISDSGIVNLRIQSTTDDATSIQFGDSTDSNVGRIFYDHSINAMRFYTNDLEQLRIDTDGKVGIGVTSPLYDLDVDGSGFFTGNVGVGNVVPTETLTVNGTGQFNNTLYLEANDSLAFENGSHWITFNDGDGNFNMRIGNYDNPSGTNECTEAGFIFHDEWSQGSGWRSFRVSDVSMSVGGLIGTDASWNQQIYYDNETVLLYWEGSARLATTSTGIQVFGNIDFSGSLVIGNGESIASDAGAQLITTNSGETWTVRNGGGSDPILTLQDSLTNVLTTFDVDGHLGIGTVPNSNASLHIDGNGDGVAEIRIEESSSTLFEILRFVGDASTEDKLVAGYNSSNPSRANELALQNAGGDITFYTGSAGGSGTLQLTIDSAGKVEATTQLKAQYLTLSNQELTLAPEAYSIWIDASDAFAPASLGDYAGSYPMGIFVNGDSGNGGGTLGSGAVQVYHTGHFSGTNISNWQSAYSFSSTFDITDYTDPKYLRSDTADTASGIITFDSGLITNGGFGVTGDIVFNSADNIHLDLGSAITFFGNNNTDHSITSRDDAWTATDDIRINSYGAVYINLDSNNNNSSSADFMIGRHGASSTISDWLLKLDGETGYLGIGNTSPSYPLDVTGDARVSSNLRVGGYVYHDGDTNTSVRFLSDRIILYAGGVNMIDCVEGAADYIDLGNIVRVDITNNYLECTGDIIGYTSTSLSDANKKENIKRIDSPIEKIQQINGYTFDWKHNGNASAGVIAQEVEKVLPEIVSERTIIDSEPQLTVEYNGLIGLLIETVKEQQEQIEDLKAEIKHIKGLF